MTLQARERLLAHEVDPRLLPGARNVVRTGLGVQPGHKVVLIVEASDAIESLGVAFLREIEDAGGDCFTYLVTAQHAASEMLTARLMERLVDADASLLLASVTGLPPAFRRRIVSAGGARRRHGHMLDASAAILMQSLRADFGDVHRLGERLLARLAKARVIHVTTTTGTDVQFRLDPTRRWHNESGLLREPGWVNLPAGEIGTSPASADGVIAPDSTWTTALGELPRAARLRLHFEDGHLVRIETRDKVVEDALLACVDGDPNGRRVGQLGFGTNLAVLTPIGSLLQDQKMPGVHLSLGHPFGELTGATWTSAVEVPLMIRRPDVSVDGAMVMVRGRYTGGIVD
jgi:leucyl aminopeptidase (aminopeptidase T)